MASYIVAADWSQAAHLTDAQRTTMLASIPPYQRLARSQGIPQLGAGLIFPIEDADILVDAFPIPKHWPRGYGMDVGWQKTAVIWRTRDPETGISYLYDEHYRSEAAPEIHAAAIRNRGSWIPGRIDPASRGRGQADGRQLLTLYRKTIYGAEDLSIGMRLLLPANNAVESGLYAMLMALQQGTLKVFRHRCEKWLAERRMYRRDERGRVIKEFDHALDASRYGFCSGDAWLVAAPAAETAHDTMVERFTSGSRSDQLSWMNNI
jgi:Terminase RNaseH-like domain